MPYKSVWMNYRGIWTPPEVFMNYRGIKVFRTPGNWYFVYYSNMVRGFPNRFLAERWLGNQIGKKFSRIH